MRERPVVPLPVGFLRTLSMDTGKQTTVIAPHRAWSSDKNDETLVTTECS